MLAIDTQIKKAYEEEQMTPEQIAEDQGLQIEAVKAKLMQVSFQYRRACNGESEEVIDGLNFTNAQLERINAVIFETATSAETADGQVDYKTRLAAATYIRDDKKGRKDVVKGMGNQTFNILNFNQALESARQGAEKMKRMVMNKPIDA